MKIVKLVALSILAIGLSPINGLAQEDETLIKDIRNARWGMSKAELIAKETKTNKFNRPKEDGNVLTFEKQDLGKGYKGDIAYIFNGGRLLKIEYKVWYESENVRGTCKNTITFRDKVQYSEHIFKELEEQHNLICFKGWYFNDTVSLNDYTYKPKDNYNCSRDGKVLVRASEIANKDQFYNIFMEMKNRRTNATFKFNEWQFNKDQFLDDLGYLPTCDDDIYNVSYWITFEPNAALKEGITNTALTIEGVMGVEEETEGEKDKKPKKKKKAKEGKEGKEGKEVDEKSDEKPKAEAEKELPEGAELPDSLEGEDTKKKGKSKKKKKKD